MLIAANAVRPGRGLGQKGSRGRLLRASHLRFCRLVLVKERERQALTNLHERKRYRCPVYAAEVPDLSMPVLKQQMSHFRPLETLLRPSRCGVHFERNSAVSTQHFLRIEHT